MDKKKQQQKIVRFKHFVMKCRRQHLIISTYSRDFKQSLKNLIIHKNEYRLNNIIIIINNFDVVRNNITILYVQMRVPKKIMAIIMFNNYYTLLIIYI